MIQNPRVTVLTAVYNGERYLDEAVASVLGQDYHDFEFVLVDDGSTDRSPEILASWAARDARIVVHTLPANLGLPAALNAGLAIARGEYVARHDADDVFLSGRMAAQVAVLDAKPEVVMVNTYIELIDARGRRIATEGRPTPSAAAAYLLNFSNAVSGHGQVMFRRDAVRELGGYDRDFFLSEDYELWTRLARVGEIAMLPRIGMRHRVHDRSVSSQWKSRQHRRSRDVSRATLSAFLGRPITDDEERALSAVWRVTGEGGYAGEADRLLREAYALFAPSASWRLARYVRWAKAERFTQAAVTLMRRGAVAEGTLHFARALRWSCTGSVTATFAMGARASMRAARAGVRPLRAALALLGLQR